MTQYENEHFHPEANLLTNLVCEDTFGVFLLLHLIIHLAGILKTYLMEV